MDYYADIEYQQLSDIPEETEDQLSASWETFSVSEASGSYSIDQIPEETSGVDELRDRGLDVPTDNISIPIIDEGYDRFKEDAERHESSFDSNKTFEIDGDSFSHHQITLKLSDLELSDPASASPFISPGGRSGYVDYGRRAKRSLETSETAAMMPTRADSPKMPNSAKKWKRLSADKRLTSYMMGQNTPHSSDRMSMN